MIKINTDKSFDFLILLFSFLIILIMLYPVYYVVIASFSNPILVLNGEIWIIPKGFNWKGYLEVFHDKVIMTGFGNTLLYSFGGTTLNLLVTLPCAYALSRKEFVIRKTINLFFTFTMFFNGGMMATYLLIRQLNLLNSRLVFILPFCLNVYNLIIVRSFFENSVPEDMWDAARIDGCNHFRYFSGIVLPLSKPVISVVTLYYLVAHWNDFFTGMMYTRYTQIQPLQNILRSILLENQVSSMGSGQSFFRIAYQQQLKYAVIIVSALPLLIIYPFIQKYFEKGVMIGAIKG